MMKKHDDFLSYLTNEGLDISSTLPAFLNLFRELPTDDLSGGIHTQGAWNLFAILRAIQPTQYIEIGVWKGFSAWLASKALPSSTSINCFDPRVKQIDRLIPIIVPYAQYSYHDFSTPTYMNVITEQKNSKIFGFIDDHQDCLERLLICFSRGFDFILFDDDYKGKGGHRSLFNLTQEAQKDELLKNTLDLTICDYVEIPALDVWIDKCPELISIAELDPSKIWRPMTLIKLNKLQSRGWTGGTLHSKENIIQPFNL